LTFADLQMAAEATRLDEVVAGTLSLQDALTAGNNRSSKFTPTQAAQFAAEWEVVDRWANTGTGLSGTLFKYTGQDDPTRVLVNSQLVMSFRSTEFIDDAARDSQITVPRWPHRTPTVLVGWRGSARIGHQQTRLNHEYE
jgi:hypothetical protein